MLTLTTTTTRDHHIAIPPKSGSTKSKLIGRNVYPLVIQLVQMVQSKIVRTNFLGQRRLVFRPGGFITYGSTKDYTPLQKTVALVAIPLLLAVNVSISILSLYVNSMIDGGLDGYAAAIIVPIVLFALETCIYSLCLSCYSEAVFGKRLQNYTISITDELQPYINSEVHFPPIKLAAVFIEFEFCLSEVAIWRETQHVIHRLLRLASINESEVIFRELDRNGFEFDKLCLSHQALSQLLLNDHFDDSNLPLELMLRVEEITTINERAELKRRHPEIFSSNIKSPITTSNRERKARKSRKLVATTERINTLEQMPKDFSLTIEGTTIAVNRKLLIDQSKYFHDLLEFTEGVGSSQNPLEMEFQWPEVLKAILSCMDNSYSNLWKEFDIKDTASILEIMKVAAYYQIGEILNQLIREVLDSPELDSIEKIHFLRSSIRYTPTCLNNAYLITYCNEKLKKYSVNADPKNELQKWLEFVIATNFNKVISEYRGWLDGQNLGNKGRLKKHVIVQIVTHPDEFSSIMPTIIKQVRNQILNSPDRSSTCKYYSNHKAFILWLADVLADPTTRFLTTENFQILWETRSLSKHSEIRSVLIQYAKNQNNKIKILELWSMGTVPHSLLREI